MSDFGVEDIAYDPVTFAPKCASWLASHQGPSGQLTAFEGPCDVDVDINPGSEPNAINCHNEKKAIAVAILTTDDLDATTVDHATVTFEGASETRVKGGEPRRHEEDVDNDGDTDLVFHFRLGNTDLTCESTQGTPSGSTFDGTSIEGTDSVKMVPGG